MNYSLQVVRVLPVLLLSLLGGCASYYNHYALFPATNSAGEPRQVRLSWQTAEYPGWWTESGEATDIRLETQCSDRVWRLSEQAGGTGTCGEGIVACGETDRDLVADTGQPAGRDTVCLRVTKGHHTGRIDQLGRQFGLTVSCRPAQTTRTVGGESVNVDYLRASAVPYVVHARKVPLGSLAQRPPELDRSVCKSQ